MPREVLDYRPPDEAVMMQFKNGEKKARLHTNVELSKEELQKLDVMREFAATQGKPTTAALATAATRYLSRAKMDPKKAVREMASTLEWQKEFFSSWTGQQQSCSGGSLAR